MTNATRIKGDPSGDQTLSGTGSGAFFGSLPLLTEFRGLADPDVYAPLPDGWIVGLADVVRSTDAIAAGRYKAVNTAGAAVISAVSNALGTLSFPYAFAGDGMVYAVDPDDAQPARRALSACMAWVGSDLALTLRGGEVGVCVIRASGRDVRVARFGPSPEAAFAMFSGGGIAWAEDELKSGRLDPVMPDTASRPDLSGLSCRFKPVQAQNGLILSVIVDPRGDSGRRPFQALVSELLAFVETSPQASLPIRTDNLDLPWPPQGFIDEARLQRKSGEHLASSLVRTGTWTLMSAAIMWAGRHVGSFSPQRYRAQIVANSDHRKFEDRLMMTIDCSPAVADRIEALLGEARQKGFADFGLHRQDTALITCVVPSPTQPNHVHFVDGAAGGYALASLELKRSRAEIAPGPISPLELQTDP